jgi:hypothetical protein
VIAAAWNEGLLSLQEATDAFQMAFQQGDVSLLDQSPHGQTVIESIVTGDKIHSPGMIELLRAVADSPTLTEILPTLLRMGRYVFRYDVVDPLDAVRKLDLMYDTPDEDILAFGTAGRIWVSDDLLTSNGRRNF